MNQKNQNIKEDIESWIETLLKEKHNELNDSEFWKKLYKKILLHQIEESKSSFYSLEKEIEEKIPTIRKQIFENQEFLELSKQILEHNPKELLVKKKEQRKRVYKFYDMFTNTTLTKLKKNFAQEELEAIIDFLLNYKNVSAFTKKLDHYFTNIEKNFPSYCLHIGNEYTTCYTPYYCHNLDLETHKNFFINYNDEMIPIDFLELSKENSYEVFKITNDIKQNFFFKKRLSKTIIEKLQFILFVPQKIRNFDFLHSLFFYNENELNSFLSEKKVVRIKHFLKEIYYLIIRDSKIVLENKQKMTSRMVFLYSYNQIKQLLNLNKKIIKTTIEFYNSTEEEISKSIEEIESFFENQTHYILIRNHFHQIYIFGKFTKQTYLDIKSFLQLFKERLPASFRYRIQEFSINNWTILDV